MQNGRWPHLRIHATSSRSSINKTTNHPSVKLEEDVKPKTMGNLAHRYRDLCVYAGQEGKLREVHEWMARNLEHLSSRV